MSYIFGNFITPTGLENIRNQKYVSGGATPLDNLLAPFWNKFTLLYPMWLAPNLITLFGFSFVVFNMLSIAYFDLTMTQNLPAWIFYAVALNCFLYQTFDATDGKQARRTGSSSPLGQLFDHGCDSYTTCVSTVFGAVAGRYGTSWEGALFVQGVMCGFYMGQLYEHYYHVLKTNVGPLGVSETQLVQIVTMTFIGLTGQDFLFVPLTAAFPALPPVFELVTLRNFLTVFIPGSGFCFFTMFLVQILQKVEGASAKLTAVLQTLPVFCVVIVPYWYVRDSPFFAENTLLCYYSFCCLFSLVTNKLIISNMAKMTYPALQVETLVVLLYKPLALAVGSYASLAILMAVNFLLLALFARKTIEEISSHLGIYCFTITKKRPGTKEN